MKLRSIIAALAAIAINSLPCFGQGIGTIKWEFPTTFGAQIHSTPAIGPDGTIYFGSTDGKLYAVTNPPAGGTVAGLRWTFNTTNPIRSSPAIGSDGTIYQMGGNGALYALTNSSSSVAVKWSINLQSPIDITIYYASSPAIGTDGTIFIGTSENSNTQGKLYAITNQPGVSSGSIRWSYPATGFIGAIASSPSIGHDGAIYFGTDAGYFYAVTTNGTAKWTPILIGSGIRILASAAISGDGATVYFGAWDNKVYAYHTSNGQLKWSFPTSHRIDSSPVIYTDGSVIVGSDDGFMYQLNADTGAQIRSWVMGSGFDSTAAIAADGTIVNASYEGGIGGFGPDGSMRWNLVDFGGVTPVFDGSPSIGPDGTIYVGSFDRRLYAISPPAPYASPLASTAWSKFGRNLRQTRNAGDNMWLANPPYRSVTITDLGTLGGNYSSGQGVNNPGVGCGYTQSGTYAWDGTSLAQRAYRYENGAMFDLGTSLYGGTAHYYGYGINDSKTIVGYIDYFNSYYPFKWTPGGGMVQLLKISGWGNTQAFVVDSGEDVAGVSVNPSGKRRAVLWKAGATYPDDLLTLAGLDASKISSAYGININGNVVGNSQLASGVYHAFKTSPLRPIDPIDDLGTLSANDAHTSGARAINGLGQVAGSSQSSATRTDAFIKAPDTAKNEGFKNLGTLGGNTGIAYGVNNVGQAVGAAKDAGGVYRAFIYLPGWNSMTNLNDFVPPSAGWDLREAYGINEGGKVTGWGYHNGIPKAFLLYPN